MKKSTGRRQFVKSSVIGLSGLSLAPALATAKSKSPKDTPGKLHILCVGAHPGDPEFGCGGTMAKYSKAGNTVVFFYLTRGEAYDNNQSHEVSAALRTKEAETSCKILNAKHATQGPEEIYDDYFKTLEAFRGLEAGVKAAEAFVHFKSTDPRTAMFGL